MSLPQAALNQGQEAIAKILTSAAVSRIMVLVVEKLDSYIAVDRRMSRVLKEFSTEIQELATEQVQKDSLKLLRNRNTRAEIAAKIRKISTSDVDQVNNLQLLAAISAKYPKGAEKVKWFQGHQFKEVSGPNYQGKSSFREKYFPLQIVSK
jgi:hypothetical protein